MSRKLDEVTKKQFIRDYKLPIQIVKEGFFEYFLELYQNQYKSLDKYELLLKTIQDVGGLEKFTEESKKLRESAINFIKEQPIYKQFESDKLEEYNVSFGYRNNLYQELNVGKTFVSIDLVKANVQSLNFYDKSLLGNSKDYETFISKFTEYQYFKESKQIRQVIFGNIVPKKQQKIQKYIMNMIFEELINHGLTDQAINATSPDELVFHLDDSESFDFMKVLKLDKFKDFSFHIEVFELKKIKSDVDVYIKDFKNKKGFEIKKCNVKIMAEVIKFIEGKELDKKDLAFYDEGRIAFYEEPLILKK